MGDMLITFSSRLLAEPHCIDVQEGQVHIVQCPQTGQEYIYDLTEQGTIFDAMAEHEAAHRILERRTDEAREYAFRRAQAHQIYRTTEPGDPARRGIGAYL